MNCVTSLRSILHHSSLKTAWPGLVGCDAERAACIIRWCSPYRVEVRPYKSARMHGTCKQMERARIAESSLMEDARVILFVDKHGDVATTPRVW